ncbi:hypothetical protein GF362_04815 [Candidatus Dojkabacteria bacterium]|nr:hypothetical protein [Candidatus Dojkabacteria bacterium]
MKIEFHVKKSTSSDDDSDYFPWQSWSPVKPRFPRLPIYDYCPVKENSSMVFKHKSDKLKQKITGWCSWYAYGKNISGKKLLAEAQKIKELKLEIEYILIDGGWCEIGDWRRPYKSKFPEGLESIIDQIRKLGFKIGLWMSPFQTSKNAELVSQHPDWLVSDNGKYVDALRLTPWDRYFSWGRYMLDFSMQEVQEYIFKCITIFVKKWKIDLLKLDFLYTPYFNPKFKTITQPDLQLKTLFKYIKKHFPKIYLSACGCPLEIAKGLVDSIRIGKDTTVPFLYNKPLLGGLINKRNLKLLERKMRLLKKQDYDQYYNLDPDAFVSMPETGFSKKDIERLRNIIFGSKVVFWGDRLSN